MAAYNPPLAETDAYTGPPVYDNVAKLTLGGFALVALPLGTLVTVSTLLGAHGSADQLTRSMATMVWLILGLMLLLVGMGALFAYLAARSVAYDLQFRLGSGPDATPASTVSTETTLDTEADYTEVQK